VAAEIQHIRHDNGVEPAEPLKLDEAGDPHGGLSSFHAAIREGGDCHPSLHDGLCALAVVLAAEESAKSGRPVRMKEMFPELFETTTREQVLA
jgi:predicted dehydrogenase